MKKPSSPQQLVTTMSYAAPSYPIVDFKDLVVWLSAEAIAPDLPVSRCRSDA
jgi:hypothetical protein